MDINFNILSKDQLKNLIQKRKELVAKQTFNKNAPFFFIHINLLSENIMERNHVLSADTEQEFFNLVNAYIGTGRFKTNDELYTYINICSNWKEFFGVANSFQEAFTLINNYCDGVAEEIYTDYKLSDQQKLSLLFKLYCLSAENRDHPCFIPNENEGYKGKKSR